MRWLACFMVVLRAASLTGAVLAQSTLADRLNVFKDVADAIGAAGDALTKVADGIAHLVETGNAGWTYVSAQRTYSRLGDISARATNLAGVRQMAVVNSIDEFLAKPTPTPLDWVVVKSGLEHVGNELTSLLTDLQAERSDFIREDAYTTLVQTLGQRSALLAKLAALPSPSTDEERNALRAVNEKYKALIASFQAAIKQLNDYLKLAKPT